MIIIINNIIIFQIHSDITKQNNSTVHIPDETGSDLARLRGARCEDILD